MILSADVSKVGGYAAWLRPTRRSVPRARWRSVSHSRTAIASFVGVVFHVRTMFGNQETACSAIISPRQEFGFMMDKSIEVSSPSYSPHSRDSLSGHGHNDVWNRIEIGYRRHCSMSGQNLPCPPPTMIRFCHSSLPSICQKKKVTAAFTTAAGSVPTVVSYFWQVPTRQLGLIDALAAIIPDHRDPDLIPHIRWRTSCVGPGLRHRFRLPGCR